MSSIYRKGRDGYYYYQAYLYNHLTGKKNKRIYHSLGTKSEDEAKEKQIKLDLKYESERALLNRYQKKYKGKILLIFLSLSLILGSSIYFISFNLNKNNVSMITDNNLKNNSLNDLKMGNNEELKPKIIANIKIKKESFEESKPTIVSIITPKEKKPLKLRESDFENINYTIQRTDKLSGKFEQGKFYVTVDKNISKENQLILCKKIAKNHSEFDNIIICLYAKDKISVKVNPRKIATMSFQEQKESWVAMYSYNSVEGEYFDDNPNGYFGND